jgi:hypothetical protein
VSFYYRLSGALSELSGIYSSFIKTDRSGQKSYDGVNKCGTKVNRLRQGFQILILFILVLFPGGVQAHTSADLTTAPENRHLAKLEGLIVDSIEIDNRNIYDTEDERYRHFVFKLVNKLHYKTRSQVIQREVLLNEGEPFSAELAEETARNLRQRLPIFDAWIETEKLPNGHLLVRVVTIDEWTLSGGVSIRRDGNETKYSFGVAERNLLGNNQRLALKYFVQPSDDNYVLTRFSDLRVFGQPYALVVAYGDNPLDRYRRIGFAHPFYNLLQNTSFGAATAKTSGRRDVYHENRLIAYSNYKGDQTRLWGAYRTGSYARKIGVSSEYIYRYEHTTDRRWTKEAVNFQDTSVAEAAFPVDSLYHQVGLGIQLANFDFVKLKQIDGFLYTEDFVLGQLLTVSLARAFTSDFNSFLFDLFEAELSQGYRFSSNLALLTYRRQIWFNRGQDIRKATSFSAYLYNQSLSFLTIAVRGTYRSDWQATGAETVTIGGTNDLRGYNKVYRTGNRKGVFNFEGRFYPNLEILSLVFGGAVFVDAARTWRLHEPLSLKDFAFSVGAGLRVAFERSTKNRLLRIDVAYSQVNGWQLSIGTDQYFRAQDASLRLTTP